MNVESRVSPAEQHPGSIALQEFFFNQKADDPCPEEFFQRCKAELGHDMKHPRSCKESVCHQGMKMGVKVEVFTEGVDGHDGSAHPVGKVQGCALKIEQASVGDAAEFLDESPMKAKVGAQHLGNADGDVPVGNGCKNGFGEEGAEELDLLLVAGGAEPAPLAGEGKEVFVGAMIAAYPCKSP